MLTVHIPFFSRMRHRYFVFGKRNTFHRLPKLVPKREKKGPPVELSIVTSTIATAESSISASQHCCPPRPSSTRSLPPQTPPMKPLPPPPLPPPLDSIDATEAMWCSCHSSTSRTAIPLSSSSRKALSARLGFSKSSSGKRSYARARLKACHAYIK